MPVSCWAEGGSARAELKTFSLPSSFWKNFAQRHWEKRPLVLRRPLAAPMTTPEDLFEVIVTEREKLARREKRHLRFFERDKIRRADLRPMLPRRDDVDLAGYRGRMKQSLGGARFGLVVVDYPEFDARVEQRLREFLRPLQKLAGTKIKSKTLLFLGDYVRTPVGIHKDPHGTFVFVIEGRKRFRTWPGNFFADAGKIAGRLKYRQFLAGSTTVEGAAGDLIYWPASYWHIGESVGGFSISLNVGVFS